MAEITWVCSVYAQCFHKECLNTDAKHLSHHYSGINIQMARKKQAVPTTLFFGFIHILVFNHEYQHLC